MAGRDRKRRGFTSRTKQRNRALDVIFEADERSLLAEDDLRALLAERQVVSTAQVPIGQFGSQIVEAYADNIDDVDTIVEASSEDWAMSRMNAVDRSILRAAAAELLYIGTDRSQLIPEWASLAREFSTDRSVGFVMGILNRVADIREREKSTPRDESLPGVRSLGEPDRADPASERSPRNEGTPGSDHGEGEDPGVPVQHADPARGDARVEEGDGTPSANSVEDTPFRDEARNGVT